MAGLRPSRSAAIPIRVTQPRISASTVQALHTGKQRSIPALRPSAAERYNTYGGPWLAQEMDVEAFVAAGDKGIDLLPSGHASITIGQSVQIDGPHGPKTIKLAFLRGLGFAPSPVWLDSDNRFFGNAGVISLLPEGYEGSGPKLKALQDQATAAMVRGVAHQFLSPANRTPTLVDHVLMFDSVAGRYLPNRAVLIADGKVAAVGPAGSIKAPPGVVLINGRGKTLTPGLWDSHQHVGDDWNLLQNVATGMTNYRSPGTMIDEALSIYRRRAAGDLLAPDGKISVIIDRKDPLAAQGALTVSSAEEAIAAVDKIKAAGLWGVKFYTSMNPAWIAPASAEAHKLGLHVHGHVPAGMRPLDAVRAGYDEVTHINFILMQAMPQEVVDKSNTAARLEGPARYGKDVDLDAPAMKAFLCGALEAKDDHRSDADGMGAADDLRRQHALPGICAVCADRTALGRPWLEDRRLSPVRRPHARRLSPKLRQDGGACGEAASSRRPDRRRHGRLWTGVGARTGALSAGGPQQLGSAADRNHHPCRDDRHGRSHRIDRARKDGGHHLGGWGCVQGSSRTFAM
jgi:hypothetical protein